MLTLGADSSAFVPTKVTSRRVARRECMRIRFPGGELVCTPDHPIYSPESGGYEPAARWVEGVRRKVLVAIGERPSVQDIVEATAFVGVREVVDISVDAPTRDFVAGGILVHNKSFDPEILESAHGPPFRLEASEPLRELQIRACFAGREAQPAPVYSYAEISFRTHDDPSPIFGDMQYVVQAVHGEHSQEREGVSGSDVSIYVEPLVGMCEVPWSIVFERLDGPSDGGISVHWSVVAGADPARGEDLGELELALDLVTES